MDEIYENIYNIYENVYESVYENVVHTFYNYFQKEKPDIFTDINLDIINIYTAVNILNERKKNIDNYFIPNNFDVSNKISILKYKLSFCLKSKKDMTDDMIMHIENYKNKINKNEIEIQKIIDDAIVEIKDDIEMVNLENRYNKLKDETEIIFLENRLNKLNENEEESEEENTDDKGNGNDGCMRVSVKQKSCLV